MKRAEEGGEDGKHAFFRHNFNGDSRLFWDLVKGLGGGQAQVSTLRRSGTQLGQAVLGPKSWRSKCGISIPAVLRSAKNGLVRSSNESLQTRGSVCGPKCIKVHITILGVDLVLYSPEKSLVLPSISGSDAAL